jgi:hypothetical protein
MIRRGISLVAMVKNGSAALAEDRTQMKIHTLIGEEI